MPRISGLPGGLQLQLPQSWDIPKRQHMIRGDYQPTDRDRLYVRASLWRADNQGYRRSCRRDRRVGPACYAISVQGSRPDCKLHAHFSPNIVNEFMAGARIAGIRPGVTTVGSRGAQPDKFGYDAGPVLSRKIILTTYYRWLVSAAFRRLLRSRGMAVCQCGARTPRSTLATRLASFAALTRSSSGMFADRGREYEGEDGTFAGSLAFGRDVNNPLDSNYAYANALLGNYGSYTESTSRPGYNGRQTTIEWFAQDRGRSAESSRSNMVCASPGTRRGRRRTERAQLSRSSVTT